MESSICAVAWLLLFHGCWLVCLFPCFESHSSHSSIGTTLKFMGKCIEVILQKCFYYFKYFIMCILPWPFKVFWYTALEKKCLFKFIHKKTGTMGFVSIHIKNCIQHIKSPLYSVWLWHNKINCYIFFKPKVASLVIANSQL